MLRLKQLSSWSATRPLRESLRSASRSSRRRFSADNTRGRSDRVRDIIGKLKQIKDTAAARACFTQLHPRDQKDVLKALHEKRKRHDSGLPKFYSTSFRRPFYFREEDLEESSTLGKGPGGQATNRRKQTVLLRHVPTDMMVKVSRFPSLRLNRRAAREVLNLRLEEKWAGRRSLLGKAKVTEQRRAARRRQLVERLRVRGAVLASRDSQSMNVFAFLRGEEPLPPYAMVELASSASQEGMPDPGCRAGLRVTALLNEECRNLWPLLCAAYTHANSEYPMLDVAQRTENGDIRTDVYRIPALLCFLFPTVKTDQLQRCRQDPLVCARVRAAVHCLCELFGLHLREGGSGTQQWRVVKDGLNWIERKGRFCSHGDVTNIAAAVWHHVCRSLCDMEVKPEGEAVRKFIALEFRALQQKGKMKDNHSK